MWSDDFPQFVRPLIKGGKGLDAGVGVWLAEKRQPSDCRRFFECELHQLM